MSVRAGDVEGRNLVRRFEGNFQQGKQVSEGTMGESGDFLTRVSKDSDFLEELLKDSQRYQCFRKHSYGVYCDRGVNQLMILTRDSKDSEFW